MKNAIQLPRRKKWSLSVLLTILVGGLFLVWLSYTPPGLLGKADALAYAVCHRIDLRSFHLGDRALPLCARCTGMYLGAMAGLGYLAIRYPRRSGTPPARVLFGLGFFALAFFVDGTNSFLSLLRGLPVLYEPDNILRISTGFGMGLVLATMVFPSFNQSVWKKPDPRPVFPDLISFLLLITIGSVIVISVIIQNTLLLYAYALISAAGVLIMLTAVTLLIGLMLLRLENRFERWSDLLLPALGGFGLSLLFIGLVDLARFLLTHTWGGFEFG